MADQPREPVEPPVPDPDPVPDTRPRSRKRMYVFIAVIVVALLAGLIYYRRYHPTRWVASRTSAVQSDFPEPDIPKDVVFADENQVKNLTIEPVTAREFTIDHEVTGKVGFNEN